MPYDHNEQLNPPEINSDLTIWRYMDFKKFQHLINNSSLYFTQLLEFAEDDIWEGAALFPIPNSEGEYLFKKADYKRVHANCWTICEYENLAMWKIYANGSNGIAIKSSFRNVEKFFKNENYYIISSGQVVYSIETDFCYKQPQDNYFKYFLRKRIYFEFEKELRFLAFNNTFSQPPKTSIDIKVNLNSLIDEVVIAPEADENHKKKVIDLLTENYLEKPVNLSKLDRRWIKNLQ